MPAPEFTLGGMTPREFYAFELKRYREAMVPKMTQEQLGVLVFCSGAYIGQLETTARVPQIELSRLIDKVLNTDGALERLHGLLGFTHFSDHFAYAAAHETHAVSISESAGQIFPGVLQTAEYARALYVEAASSFSDEEVDRMATARTERGRQVTGSGGPELWFILDEAVLRRVIGGRETMAAQLYHVADLARTRRVDLQVVPYDVGAHSLLSGLVNLTTFADAPPLVYVETAFAGQLLDDEATVAKCRRAFDLARASAMSRRVSLAFLESIAEEYESGRT